MPGPDQWTEQDFEAAKALRDSGKGSAAQKAQLEKALNSYWTRQTGNLGIADDTPEQVSRETRSSDPFAAYDAETAKLSADGNEALTARAPERPGKLETFANSAANGMNLGMGDTAAAWEATNAMDPGAGLQSALSQVQSTGALMADRRMQGARDNPKTAAVGEFMGTAAAPPMAAFGALGGMAGRALGFTGKAGRAAEASGAGMVQGGVEGAATAPEGQEAEGAGWGALGGAVLGPVAAFAGDALSGVLGRKSKELTARASGPEKGDIQQILLNKGSGGLEDIGARLETHGIRSLEDAERVNSRSGEMIGQLSKTARHRVDLSEAGHAVKEIALDLAGSQDPTAYALAEKLMQHANPLIDQPARTYEVAHKLRKYLDKLIYKVGEKGEKDTMYADALGVGVAKIRAAMDDAASKEGPEFHAAMKQANEAFSTSKQALEYLSGQRAGDMTGSSPGASTVGTLGINLLTSGRTRARVTAPPTRALSRAVDRRAVLPELAPQMGGGALGYFVPEEESQ